MARKSSLDGRRNRAPSAPCTRQLAATLFALAEKFVREADPTGTTAVLVPCVNGELDQASAARLLRR